MLSIIGISLILISVTTITYAFFASDGLANSSESLVASTNSGLVMKLKDSGVRPVITLSESSFN